MSSKRIPFSGFLLSGVMGCTGPVSEPSYDDSTYREHLPRSILVLPPLNEPVAVSAPYSYLTTVTKPVAERGYYFFPVSVVEEYMKDNGLPTAGEMHGVSLNKIDEIIGVVIVQIESTVIDRPRLLAKRANRRMFFNKADGLLVGPLHPEFGAAGDD